MKKILIFYTSVGLGHKSIAENIGYYLEQAGHTVKLQDILQVQAGGLVSTSTSIHRFINTYLPFVWSFLYKSTIFTRLALPWRLKVAAKNYANTKMVIDGFGPDVIITTQTTASAVIAFLKQKGLYTGKFGIAFSDYHLHPFWLYSDADFYLANIQEQKTLMVRQGISPEKIFVCGMPLGPEKYRDANEVKKSLGIDPEDRLVLFGSGSLGTGFDSSLIQAVVQSRPGIHAVVVTGKNDEAYKTFTEIFRGMKVLVLGFHENMAELYQAADIFIGKPGGLSVAEAVRYNLPVLVSHMLPGQEELNFEYLEDKGFVMPEAINIESEIEEEIETHAFKNALVKNPSRALLFPGPGPIIEAINSIK